MAIDNVVDYNFKLKYGCILSDKETDPEFHQKTRNNQLGGCSKQRGHSNHGGSEDGTGSRS